MMTVKQLGGFNMSHDVTDYTSRDLGRALASAIHHGDTRRADRVRAEIKRRLALQVAA